MRLLSYRMPKNYNLFLFGDDHIGARLRHEKGFLKLCRMLHSEYNGCKKNYGIHFGDFIEAITIDDPRYSDFDTLQASILAQMEAARRIYRPIADDMLLMLDGNHPFKLHKIGKITATVCHNLGIDFGTYSCKASFHNKDGSLQFKGFFTHGSGSISSIADDPERRYLNWRLALKRKLRDQAGDCLLMAMGHTHKLIISKPTKVLYVTDNGEGIKDHFTEGKQAKYIHPDYRFYVNTGSFLKIYGDDLVEDSSVPPEQSKLGSGYAERAMYAPNVLGFAVALIRGGKLRDVKKVIV